MIESWDDMTLFERREMLWGLRDGSATHMNRIRRENFESVKALLLERDMPKSVTQPPAPSAAARLKFMLVASEQYGSEDFTALRFFDGRVLL